MTATVERSLPPTSPTRMTRRRWRTHFEGATTGWSLGPTEASQRARLRWVEERLKATGFAADMFRSSWERSRNELQAPAKWERVPADVAAPLESQYQRFLMHWRDRNTPARGAASAAESDRSLWRLALSARGSGPPAFTVGLDELPFDEVADGGVEGRAAVCPLYCGFRST